MTTITMTLSSPEVQLKDGKGSITASVTNGGATPERVVLGAFPAQATTPPAPTYTTIPNPLRTIAPGLTEQYVLNFDTTGAPAGNHGVKLIAYSADGAPEDYADQAHVVTLVVPQPAEQPKPAAAFPWLWVIVGGVALLAVIGGVVWFLLKDVTVPAVVGKPQAEAVQLLKDAGFSVTASETESAQTTGTVVKQVPDGDKPAGRGSNVALEIATPVRTTVPAVLNSTIENAKAAFIAAKIKLDFTQGSSCQASPGGFLLRCVVTGVNPDVGTRVNINALVVVRTEVKQVGLFENLPSNNICMVNPSLCVLQP
jgi:PASTA domain